MAKKISQNKIIAKKAKVSVVVKPNKASKPINPPSNQKNAKKIQNKPIAKPIANKKNIKPQLNVQTKKNIAQTKKVESKKKADVQVIPPKIVKVTKKSGAVVDSKVPNSDKYTVLTYNGVCYDATLNQSNIDCNNNKFYIIQVIQCDSKPNEFFVWNRWGRVGVDGAFALRGPFDIHKAIQEYQSKLDEKTKKGNYTKIEINYDDSNAMEIEKPQKGKKKTKVSKGLQQRFHPKIIELIELIFNTTMMKNQMLEIGYDAKKMPLGKLAKSTLNEGYKVLNVLMDSFKQKKDLNFIKDQSSKFYSLIPHDFGFQKMSNFILDTEQKVRNKLEMLQTLDDMQVATKIVEETGQDTNPVGQYLKKLECDIDYVEPNSPEFKLLSEYFENTKGNYSTLKLLDAYKIKKNLDFDSGIQNRMLLWHGSRLGNFVGILSQGLRIAPPEAPVSGYNLGKGLYFADLLEKSAPYCRSYGQIGLVLLVDVAVGDQNLLYSFNCDAGNLPKGKHSVKACGTREPPQSSYIKQDGYHIPIGKPVNTNLKQSVPLNEYVVYSTRQASFRYLLKVQF